MATGQLYPTPERWVLDDCGHCRLPLSYAARTRRAKSPNTKVKGGLFRLPNRTVKAASVASFSADGIVFDADQSAWLYFAR